MMVPWHSMFALAVMVAIGFVVFAVVKAASHR